MSTPSPRPLSFNAAPLSLYRQLLSIIRWLGKMASATPEELLLCSLLSVGCGLERYRNSKKSLVVELKGITPLTTHTHRVWRCFYEEVCLHNRLRESCPPRTNVPDCRSLTWVALSIPITNLYFDGFWTTIDSAHPPSLSAAELTSAAASIFLSEFSPRLYLQPLKVHSLAWRHREENQNRSRQARITGETLQKKRRRKNDVNSGDALPEDRAQGWKSLSMPGIVSEVRFTYLLFSFQSVLCYFCLQTKMVGGNY